MASTERRRRQLQARVRRRLSEWRRHMTQTLEGDRHSGGGHEESRVSLRVFQLEHRTPQCPRDRCHVVVATAPSTPLHHSEMMAVESRTSAPVRNCHVIRNSLPCPATQTGTLGKVRWNVFREADRTDQGIPTRRLMARSGQGERGSAWMSEAAA